jgi:hypothetical protein
MAIAVRHEDGQREAVVEFPAGRQPRFAAPLLKPQHIDPALVANAIASAIGAAGRGCRAARPSPSRATRPAAEARAPPAQLPFMLRREKLKSKGWKRRRRVR